MLFVIIINYQNRRKAITDDWQRRWRAYKDNVKRLPTLTKTLLLASFALGLFFIGSVIYLRIQQKQSAAESFFQESVKQIKQKKDSIEASLIYKNEALAAGELSSAKELLAKLNCAPKEHKNDCDNLTKSLRELTIRIQKITDVNAELLVDWSSVASGAFPQEMIKLKSKLIAVSATSSNLLAYDLLTKETKVISTYPTISGFSEGTVPKENDYALLAFSNRSLLQLNPGDNSVKLLEISYPNENVNIQGNIVYSRYLYSLDTQNNLIYKHDAIKDGFGRGKEWNKDGKSSIKGAVDIAIDGDVFILSDNGQISKFTSGFVQPFSIQGLDPALTNGGKIWTYNDVDNIYVLDPTGKRLIVLTKEGKLVKQITSNQFKKPTAFVIDTPNNVAYVVDGTRLFKVELK